MCVQVPIITARKYTSLYDVCLDCWGRRNEYKNSILVPFAVQFVKQTISHPAKNCWICKYIDQVIVRMWHDVHCVTTVWILLILKIRAFNIHSTNLKHNGLDKTLYHFAEIILDFYNMIDQFTITISFQIHY